MRFQSLSRDSVYSNMARLIAFGGYGEFQSLSRDSVYSNDEDFLAGAPACVGFNPSVGIAFIQTALRIIDSGAWQKVSIPQSG